MWAKYFWCEHADRSPADLATSIGFCGNKWVMNDLAVPDSWSSPPSEMLSLFAHHWPGLFIVAVLCVRRQPLAPIAKSFMAILGALGRQWIDGPDIY